MNTLGDLGEKLLEQGQSVVKQQAQLTGQALKKQVAGSPQEKIDQGSNEQGSAQQQQASSQNTDQQTTEEFVKNLYAPSNATPQRIGDGQKPPSKFAEHLASEGKTPEEIQKLEALRKQLHETYYKQLTRPPKHEEENAQEKVEREEKEKEQQKMEELQEDQKKAPVNLPPSARQGSHEKYPGASG